MGNGPFVCLVCRAPCEEHPYIEVHGGRVHDRCCGPDADRRILESRLRASHEALKAALTELTQVYANLTAAQEAGSKAVCDLQTLRFHLDRIIEMTAPADRWRLVNVLDASRAGTLR